MKNLLYVYILSFYIIILVIYYIYSLKNNNKRHLGDEYSFAHFSEINRYNYLLYPSLIYTHPIKYVLNENEALWIPKGWWHWIESYDCIAINFWLSDLKKELKFEYPFISKQKLSKKIIKKINNYNNQLTIWNSLDDVLYNDNKNKNQLTYNEIIITLPGYSDKNKQNFKNDKINTNLINKIDKFIKIPKFLEKIKNSDIDYNLWISNKFHDTGLHYDDNYGLLCVLKGKKNITLYPPSDSSYLYPLNIIPFWANNDPLIYQYNANTFIEKLNKHTSLPSSRLLYETLKCYNNRKIILLISQLISKYGNNRIIWGFKLHNNIIRWELYIYHYTNVIYNKSYSFNNIVLDDSQSSYIYNNNNNNMIIHSFDIYENGIIGNDIHFYYNNNNDIVVPFFGKGNTLKKDNTLQFESDFVLDTSTRFIENYDYYMKKINYTNDKVFNLKFLLHKYKCSQYCIHNKHSEQIFIQYLDISINDFILFLTEFNYHSTLIEHIKLNINKYNNIIHEITIVYDINTTKPIRTAFYGLV
jgi:hypothetical protein